MSQHCGVNTATAVESHPIHGFTLVGDFGEGISEDVEALGGAVLAVSQLFGGVGPVGGQAAGDGVGGVADEELEIVAGAVSGRQAFAFRDADEGGAGADGDAIAERLLAPAQADHVVEFRPVQECIIGGMKDDKAAAAADVGFQCLLDVARPASAGGGVPAIEVVDHHIDVLEVGLGGPGGDFDREAAGTLEHALDGARSGRPIVIVHAVDDERGEFGCGGRTGQCQQRGREELEASLRGNLQDSMISRAGCLWVRRGRKPALRCWGRRRRWRRTVRR